MEKNTELAYKTLDQIRANPQGWDQNEFFCGTTACFAGHAILIHYGLSDEDQYREWQKETNALDTIMIAREALGWNEREAAYVFGRFTTDFTELESVVKDVLNGKFS